MSGVPQAKGTPWTSLRTLLESLRPLPRSLARKQALRRNHPTGRAGGGGGGGGAAPRCTTFLSGCKWLPRSPLSAQFPDPPAPGAGAGPCTSRPPAIIACRGSRGCCGLQPARPGAGQLPSRASQLSGFTNSAPISGSGVLGRKQSVHLSRSPSTLQPLSLQSVPTEDPPVALARGSHAITRAVRFRCAARAAGTGLPGDPWCAVAAASSAPVPRRRSRPCCLPRASRGLIPAPGALGRRRPSLCANLRISARPSYPAAQLGGRARGALVTPRRVSPGGAAGPGFLQPPGCVRELSPPPSFYRCHDWSRLSPTAGSASAPTGTPVQPRGRVPSGM